MPQFEDDKRAQKHRMVQQIHHYQELIQHRNHQIVRWFIILLVLSAVGITAGYRHLQYLDWILRSVCMFGIGFLARKLYQQHNRIKRAEHLNARLEEFE